MYLSLIFAQSLPQVTPTVTMITPTPTVKATPVSTPRVPTVVTDGASLYGRDGDSGKHSQFSWIFDDYMG